MDCQRVAELLPWLANKTLPDSERDQVRTHLATCATCREQAHETGAAWQVFDYHPSSQALVDYVFDGASRDVATDVIERHLAMCPECADELRHVRTVHTRSEKQRRAEERRHTLWSFWPSRLTWGMAAACAALMAMTVVNVAVWMGGRSSLQREVDRLRAGERQLGEARTTSEQRLARLEGELARLNAPAINPPVIELFPVDLVARGEPTDARELRVPDSVSSLTLILGAPNAAASPTFSIEIVDNGDRPVWSTAGLIRQRTRDFTISLPAKFLSAGDYRINVYGEGGGARTLAARYLIRIP